MRIKYYKTINKSGWLTTLTKVILNEVMNKIICQMKLNEVTNFTITLSAHFSQKISNLKNYTTVHEN